MMAGQLLADRYELGPRLGIGGMSKVMRAFDRRLEREVAVKLLAEHLADDSQFVARFRREALAAARLVHPNIVQVFDFGLDDATHRHYIVMELVDGRSGAELLREHGALPVDPGLDIVTQACLGLEYAHRNGVVHRDVKPGNLLQGQDAVVKLADFGIAKALSEESSITQVGSVLGTAAYLAPEQAAGEPAGPPSDLYSLGVLTYQLLSGRLPYEAQSLTELALMQQREVPPRLDELRADVTPQLALAVDRALALDPRQRFASAAEMRRALLDGARGIGDATPATARAAGPSTEATRVADPGTEPTGATRVARAPVEARRPRAPREPRPAPAPVETTSERRRPTAAPAAARAQRRRGGTRRFMGTLLLLLLLAAGGAAAVVLTSRSDNAVHLRRVVYDDVQKATDELKQLVNDNTR
jgi:serine/threonine-protein kinase